MSETPDEASRSHRVELDPETFMKEWSEKNGQKAASAWREVVANVSTITGLELRSFPGGGPYLCLSNTPIGTVSILRLATASPFVRDLLNKPGWESNPKTREARQRFRDALIQLPGARYGGTAGRVYVPVQTVAERRDEIRKAISDLAGDLSTN